MFLSVVLRSTLNMFHPWQIGVKDRDKSPARDCDINKMTMRKKNLPSLFLVSRPAEVVSVAILFWWPFARLDGGSRAWLGLWWSADCTDVPKKASCRGNDEWRVSCPSAPGYQELSGKQRKTSQSMESVRKLKTKLVFRRGRCAGVIRLAGCLKGKWSDPYGFLE